MNYMITKKELRNMNYILGKKEDNQIFTKFELEALQKIDLLDEYVVRICKLIWENRNVIEN